MRLDVLGPRTAPGALAAAAALALALAPTGCDEVPCPGGCPKGHVCDDTEDVCISLLPADCTSLGCAEGDACDALTGECKASVDCLTEGCASRQLCDALTRTCVHVGGCTVDGCPGDRICDRGDGLCKTRPCAQDDACREGLICAASGVCVPGCRPERPCPPGSICLAGATSAEPGLCSEGCREDADCPHGQLCAQRGPGEEPARAGCEPEPPCGERSDCRQDEICDRGTCVRGPCTEGIACPSDSFCDAQTGDCLPAHCQDDFLEDNDNSGEASPILPQSYTQLSLCPGDSDWFLLTPGAGATLQATLRFDPASADLDIVALDPDLYVLGASRGMGSPEAVRMRVGPSGEVLLHILGHAGSGALYVLDISVEEPVECDDDERGPNGSFHTPANLPAGTHADLALCPGTEDWYTVDLREGDGLEAFLTVQSGELPGLERLGPEGGREVALPDGDGLALRVARVEQEGAHLLRVHDGGRARARYTLDIRTHPDGLPCRDDELEENDDAETASPVVGNTYSQLTACPGDPDWFALELPRRGGSVRVTLRALDGPGAGLPILDGFEPGGTPATVVEDRADGRFVGIGPVNRPGRVLLRVLGAPGALPAAYDLEVEVDHGPEPCVDDHLEGAEGNDSAVRAALIRPGRLDELVLCPESMEDWYAVDVGREGGLRLRVRGSGMRCELRTTDGARLIQACEPEGEGLRSVARIGLDRGRYRLRVLGDGPAEGRAYRLELEVL